MFENATVELHGELLNFGEVVRYMDPVLFDAAVAAEKNESDARPLAQRILDRYLELHLERHGFEFARGELASLW